jgi:hypothetical protein
VEATGIAPSASNFEGTDFQTTQRLERLLKRSILSYFFVLKGISCLLWSFYIVICKLARKTYNLVMFVKKTLSSWNEDNAIHVNSRSSELEDGRLFTKWQIRHD